MKICEVMEITFLTKKAINYYEEEGLITPEINEENNYRNYKKEDIDRLIEISVLRQLDLPVKNIKEIIGNKEKIKSILENHLNELANETKRLERSKNLLKACLNDFNENDNLSGFTKKLSDLNKALDLDARGREGYIKKQLQRIFPGNFGKMMLLNYSPFLNEKIDTKEKEEAWISLVKYLDEADSINYSEEIIKVYDKMSEEDIKKSESFISKEADRWLNMDEEGFKKERAFLLESFKNMDKNEDLKSAYKITNSIDKSLKKEMKKIDYYNNFNENLKILSEKYKKYTEIRNDFFKTLNVEIDDEGNVTIKNP